jgi:hypothetical protein
MASPASYLEARVKLQAFDQLAELLRFLSPDGAYIDSIVGNIFENSEQDGYAGFLNASPDPVAGSTHRQALVVLRNDGV